MLARVPLRDDGGFLSIPARLAGSPVRLMFDTGSDAGLITPAAMRAYRLARDPGSPVRLQGTGGAGRSMIIARMAGLTIGDFQLGDVLMPVGPLPGSPNLVPPVVGFLGGDVLSHFDLDIDLPHATFALYRVAMPSFACAPPPVWNTAFTTIPLTAVGVRLALTAMLDGRPITALLDTGARSRIVSRQAALRVGVTAAALATDPGGINSGVDLHEQVYHWHVFKSLAIGSETARAPVLTVATLSEPFDMLLGTDWLQGHEVWISYATRQLFLRKGPD